MQHAFTKTNFRAVPLSSITKPVEDKPSDEPERLSCPPLPKRGCREYLRRMRKLLELNLSFGKTGFRAQRRAYAKQLRFA